MVDEDLKKPSPAASRRPLPKGEVDNTQKGISSPLPSGEVGTSVPGEGNKKHFARQLRKSATNAEKMLWQRLRNRQILGFKFKRQEIIGKYIVDFVCIEKKLIIELDGGQHVEQFIQDVVRTTCLNKLGYEVVRFWNNEVLTNINGVLECIVDKLS